MIKEAYAAESYGPLSSGTHRSTDGYKQACALQPDSALSYNNLGVVSIGVASPRETALYYARALQLAPDLAVAHYGFAIALTALGLVPANRHHYLTAIALSPNLGVAYNNLALELNADQELPLTPALLKHAIRSDPGNPDYWVNLGAALEMLDQSSDALKVLTEGIARFPCKASFYNNLGVSLSALAENMGPARTAHQRAITLDPAYISAYRNLLNLDKPADGQKILDTLLGHAEQENALSAGEQVELHFALGTLYDQRKEHRQAFHHWSRGNGLLRERSCYDEAATLGYFERMKALFSPSFLQSYSLAGDTSSLPVFIVGMPRSGSTLVEQILSAHPAIHGAGELRHVSSLLAKYDLSAPHLEPRQVTAAALDGFADEYLTVLRAKAPEACCVVDKMLNNFQFLGLLHLAFPNARFIHVLRSPIDSCMSNYSRRLGHNHPYVHDLGQLGRYYKAYRGLMEHWRGILPMKNLIEIRYEDVVEDLEGQARHLIEFLGLPWDARCLEFYNNQRSVQTASQFQVRKPLYRDGVGRWKPYIPYLGPLIESVGTIT